MDFSSFIKADDLARECGVHRTMLDYHERKGRLPACPKVLGRKVYTPEQAAAVRSFFGQNGGRKWVDRDPVTLENSE